MLYQFAGITTVPLPVPGLSPGMVASTTPVVTAPATTVPVIVQNHQLFHHGVGRCTNCNCTGV